MTVLISGLPAVSYTHLDVYKRQGVHGVIVLKLKKISPREGDFPIILLRGGIADDL